MVRAARQRMESDSLLRHHRDSKRQGIPPRSNLLPSDNPPLHTFQPQTVGRLGLKLIHPTRLYVALT